MTDLGERFAAALRDAVPQPPHQLDPQEIRDRSGRRRGTLRRYAPALAAAVVVAVAIGLALVRSDSGDSGRTPAGAGGPSKATQQPSASFTARVTLNRTTAAADGEPIRGTLFVDNETGAPIVISDACNGWYAVGLANDDVSFDPGWGQVGCPSDQLPIGLNTYPISVATTYDSCAMPGGQPPTPACTGPAHDHMPNLPPGDYTIKIEFSGLSRDPTLGPPVTVTLTAP